MIRALIAMTLVASSAVAPAANADEVADVRCFIAAAEMAENEDKDAQNAGTIMMFYFLGRIDGRNPKADVEALSTLEEERMTGAEKKQLMASCSAQVERRGKQLSGPAAPG